MEVSARHFVAVEECDATMLNIYSTAWSKITNYKLLINNYLVGSCKISINSALAASIRLMVLLICVFKKL